MVQWTALQRQFITCLQELGKKKLPFAVNQFHVEAHDISEMSKSIAPTLFNRLQRVREGKKEEGNEYLLMT